MSSGRPPTVAELAADVGMADADVAHLLRMAPVPRSLTERLREDSDTEVGDVVAGPTAATAFDDTVFGGFRGDVELALAILDPDERRVLRLRYGLDEGVPRPLDAVAADRGISRETVRLAERRALAKLRHPASRVRLDDTLAAS